MEMAFFMMENHGEALEFQTSTPHLVVEVWGKPKDSSDDVIFPKERGHTYAALPNGFQDQVEGDHYFVAGVLYDVDDLNALLPSDNVT